MSINYAKIQNNLAGLHRKWKDYSKNERQGYQTFLSDFFACFGITFDNPDSLPFEENTGKGFADAFIKDVVIVEMKDRNKVRTREDLLKQLSQALRYWEAKGKHVPYLILCNFSDFIVYDTRDRSFASIKLAELEAKAESFAFLVKLNPSFAPEQEAISRKSAKIMGELYRSLKNRLKGRNEEIDIFVLQSLFSLFSEDIGYLPTQTFTNCVRRIRDGEDNSANVLGTLFKMMDERDSERKRGKFEHVRYFNGPLFRIKPEIVLNDDEIELLWTACEQDWSNVRPEIFGALFESTQTKHDRQKDGMHFTSEEDIFKVVGPCVVEPWEERLAQAKSLADLKKIHGELKLYRVLDPACGSGNFLVVAYRELKRIEQKLFLEYKKLSGDSWSDIQETLGWFPVTNMYGIELNAFPSFLTRVSLWITKKMVRNQYKLTEPDLPLGELKHIIAADALEVKWDDVDVVIGNPPYIGCKQIRQARGDSYFNWLGERFSNHNRMSDYCTYWFEKVLEDVQPGVRVGLVCTKTVSQNQSREASLDKVVDAGGTIFNAISKQKWSGEAQVTVSIVNFVHRGPYAGQKRLDGKKVASINSSLKAKSKKAEYYHINSEKKLAYVGVAIQGIGFIVNEKQRRKYISRDSANRKVIKPYLVGDDLNQSVNSRPSRWIVDFSDLPLEEAKQFKLPYQHVVKNVKPHRDKVRRAAHRKFWWQYGDKRMLMRSALGSLNRYIVASIVSKHVTFQFADSATLPSHLCVVIAKEDYDTLGILNSRFHVSWAWETSSTLETRIRYSNAETFETFPFPEDSNPEIGRLMKQIENYRKIACQKYKIGMTDLYNDLDNGGHELLRKLHQKLDAEVAKAYGLSESKALSNEDIVGFLTRLNAERATKIGIKEAPKREAVLAKAKGVLEKVRKKIRKKRRG
jgi:hypothetical protein